MADLGERVTMLEIGHAQLTERVDYLEEDRRKQNGALQRLESKMDQFMWWIMGILGGVVVQLVLTLLKK